MSQYSKYMSGAAALLLSIGAAGSVHATGAGMTMFKNASCACCEAWADQMRAQGMKVTSVAHPNMSLVKERYRVPASLQSCHTAVIGGYAVEGHVHFESIQRMLEEKPRAAGLTIPGMPMGAPGMTGKRMAHDVLVFGSDGSSELYERR